MTPRTPAAGSTVAKVVVEELARAGIKLVALLPDHQYDRVIEELYSDSRFQVVPVAREDEGVAICCGAFYGGVQSALLMANSGFMLTPYVLASLSMYYRIPLLMLISYRGGLGERAQFQEYQGLLTGPLLRAMGIDYWTVDKVDKLPLIGQALHHTQLFKRPVALLLEGDLHRPATPVYIAPPESSGP